MMIEDKRDGRITDKTVLFAPRLPEADVLIEGVGVVRVRALNRQEAKRIQSMEDMDERDLHLLATGLVDPKLSIKEVRQWAEASPPDELEAVSDAIVELSGLTPSRPKEVARKWEADDSGEFRPLPGPEVGHDGGADGAEHVGR
jgi:hypothetical protein